MATKEYQRKYYSKHKEQAKKYNQEYRLKHREKIKEYYKKYNVEYYRKNKERILAHGLNYKKRIKVEVLTHYGGGKCICVKCGFSDIRALCIDHINNDGAKGRRGYNIGRVAGDMLYRKLKYENYPADYQTLCCNCNIIKHFEYKHWKS